MDSSNVYEYLKKKLGHKETSIETLSLVTWAA